jgi:F-type H+-transporting ATPase subunit delta
MPLIITQPDAVSKVYAQALFDTVMAAGGKSAVEQTLAELESLVGMAQRDPKLNEFLASRIIGIEERSASIGRMLKGHLSETTVRFIQILNDKGRLNAYPAIVASFDSISHHGFGHVEVDIYTATPLSDADKATLTAQLHEKLGMPPVLHTYVEPAMLGGIRIQIEDRLVDASLSTRLAKLREQINTRGLPSVRGAVDRIFKTDAPSLNGH